MSGFELAADRIREYDGKPIKIMEVCGTHTAAIIKSGIRDVISKKISLIAGPGCPVCVTPIEYIDRLIALSMKKNSVVLSFGDMLRVPGSSGSLSQYKAKGANVRVIYSPLEAILLAKSHPDTTFYVAAVGFETTTAVYAVLVDRLVNQGIKNVKLVASLKTMIAPMEYICQNENGIDAFLCPGHVSVIIGSGAFEKLANKYKKPFVVGGFGSEQILAAICEIVRQIEAKVPQSKNMYPSMVTDCGNHVAAELIDKYFVQSSAVWRGIGEIEKSGLVLREQYGYLEQPDSEAMVVDDQTLLDMESRRKVHDMCRCGDVILGRIDPPRCPLYGKSCTPESPVGACMVSHEGACGIWHQISGV